MVPGVAAAVVSTEAAVVGAAVAGAVLSSIHPLLAMPSVPEGPRTVLNYACEAAGYGWVNGIAHGGAIALGHPLGCTGAKLTVQIINEMKRRQSQFGMVTMCIGGGMGAAGIFENLS